jgi:hypothetical protein
MNTPKAIELAFTLMLRQYAELGSDTLVRPWQSLSSEGAFRPNDDRTFPCIDVRFSPDQYNEDQATLVCLGSIEARSHADDDTDHQQASAMYEAIHNVALLIFADSQGRVTGAKAGLYAEFVALVLKLSENQCRVGGITLESGTPPMLDEQNINTIGIGIGVHFSYAHT